METAKNKTDAELTGYPSIDKPWLKYYSEEAINAPLPECTMYEYIWENNKDHLKDTALIYFGRKITYEELFKNIDKTATAFLALGVSKGDVVTIQSLSLPQVVYMIYALSKLGAIANLIYVTSTAKEVQEYLVETRSKVYVTIDSIYSILNPTLYSGIKKVVLLALEDEMNVVAKSVYRVKTKRSSIKRNENILTWKAFTKLRSFERGTVAGNNLDPVIMVYTGGTTGKTKGVVLSNYNLNVGALQYFLLGYERHNTFLSVLPPFIAFGITVTMHMPLTFGLKTVLGVSANPSEIAGFVEKYKPNYLICGTAQVEKMMNALDKKCVDLSHLICLGVGGDTLSPKLEENLNMFLKKHNSKIKVSQGYAMSETAASTAGSTYTTSKVIHKKGTVGVPFVYTNIKIVDADTNEELPYACQGEICIDAPCVMMGYYHDEQETKNILKKHDDGKIWVHTGDIGSVDEDGFITIIGRIKRIILTWENGVCHKVFPKILEDKFLKNDCIESISIIGNHQQDANNLIAFLVLQKGVAEKDAVNILEKFAVETFERYERPTEYIVKDKLPRTTIGKVDYRALEKEIEIENI